MKKTKITAILCTLAILMSFAVTVTAASGDITLNITETSGSTYTVKATAETNEVQFNYMYFNVELTETDSGSAPMFQLDGKDGFSVRLDTTQAGYKYKLTSDASHNTISTSGTDLFQIRLLGHGSGTFNITAKAYKEGAQTGADISLNSVSYEYTAEYKPFKVKIDFNNNLASDKDKDYTQMRVTVDGGMLTSPITKELSTLAAETEGADSDITPTISDGKLQAVTISINEPRQSGLETGQNYTVKIEGEGYRTAAKSVIHDPGADGTTVSFWNNAFDAVPDGESDTKNFLAGDIEMDGKIDLYDLNAVTSYYGYQPDTDTKNNYIQYDLNRDGKINAADIALVLVSWGE